MAGLLAGVSPAGAAVAHKPIPVSVPGNLKAGGVVVRFSIILNGLPEGTTVTSKLAGYNCIENAGDYQFTVDSSFFTCAFEKSSAEYMLTIETPSKQRSWRRIVMEQTSPLGSYITRFEGSCRGGSLGCSGSSSETSSGGPLHVYFHLGPLPTGPGGYTFCASEGLLCSIGGVKDAEVAYGANGKYVYKQVDGNLVCDNATFGRDPVTNVSKNCFVKAAPSGYTFCVTEGQRCEMSGSREVAYGAYDSYAYRIENGSFQCDNATFGDPIFGVPKSCYVRC